MRDLAAFGGSGCDIDRLIDATWGLERLDDAATVVRLTGGRTDLACEL